MNETAEETTTQSSRVPYASFYYLGASDEAKALIRDVRVRVEAEENRKKSRREIDAVRFNHTIERFVANLLVAYFNGQGDGWIARSMKQETFTGEVVSYTSFKLLRDKLKVLGLLDHEEGTVSFHASFDHRGSFQQANGFASTFRAASGLITLAAQHGISRDTVSQHFVPERFAVEARKDKIKSSNGYDSWRGDLVRYRRTEWTDRLTDGVQSLNNFLSGFKLGGGEHEGFVRQFNIFTSDDEYQWNKGGRLYSYANGPKTYQTLSSDERGRLTIDGESVAEIDISASYLTIFHSLVGKPLSLPTGTDPYTAISERLLKSGELSDFDEARTIAKIWLTATFGLGKPMTRWTPELSKAFKAKQRAQEKEEVGLGQKIPASKVSDASLEAYPELTKLGLPGLTWADLMFVESEVVIRTMTQLAHPRFNIPSYPVHDSLIVAEQDAVEAADWLCQNFAHWVGVVPIIKTDNEAVKDAVKEIREFRYAPWTVRKPKYNPRVNPDPRDFDL